MKILFLGIGKTKHGFLIEGIERYKKLLSGSASIEEKYLREEDDSRPDGVKRESKKLMKNIPSGFHRILLDIKGKRFTSERFGEYINDLRKQPNRGIVFIIGGSNGVCEDTKHKTDLRLSFSDMTMTHQMIRLFLAEQIYRAFSIINNRIYHK